MLRGLVTSALFLAGCGASSFQGDRRCSADDECPDGARCVLVQSVLVSTGGCLASSGVRVCRRVCDDCATATPCGCQCP